MSEHFFTTGKAYPSQVWGIGLTEINELSSPSLFKKAIKKWETESCPCRLIQTYVQNIGFL